MRKPGFVLHLLLPWSLYACCACGHAEPEKASPPEEPPYAATVPVAPPPPDPRIVPPPPPPPVPVRPRTANPRDYREQRARDREIDRVSEALDRWAARPDR